MPDDLTSKPLTIKVVTVRIRVTPALRMGQFALIDFSRLPFAYVDPSGWRFPLAFSPTKLTRPLLLREPLHFLAPPPHVGIGGHAFARVRVVGRLDAEIEGACLLLAHHERVSLF